MLLKVNPCEIRPLIYLPEKLKSLHSLVTIIWKNPFFSTFLKVYPSSDLAYRRSFSPVFLPHSEIIVIDIHQPFFDDLSERAKKDKLHTRIKTVRVSTGYLSFPDLSYNLIWLAGAAHIMGFKDALISWKIPHTEEIHGRIRICQVHLNALGRVTCIF